MQYHIWKIGVWISKWTPAIVFQSPYFFCLFKHILGQSLKYITTASMLLRSVRLLKAWNREGCTIDHQRSWCKGWSRHVPYAFCHSFISWFLIQYFTHKSTVHLKTNKQLTNHLQGAQSSLRRHYSLNLSRNSQTFREPKGSLLCSQECATGTTHTTHKISLIYWNLYI
jgi:hypothetical protein